MSKLINITASLASTGKKDSVSYTKAETTLATHAILCLMVAIGKVDADDPRVAEVPDPVIEAVNGVWEENKDKGLGVPNLARRVYTVLTEDKFEKDGETIKALDATNFPKRRDYTSIGLIFRGALTSLKCCTPAEVESAFPSYWKGKKAKKA